MAEGTSLREGVDVKHDRLVFWLVLIGFVMLYGCGSGGSQPATSAAFVVTPFSDTTGRTEVPCPPQTDKTAVLFTFGQSNSANQLEHKYASTHALNYWKGKCYLAEDPLLGATDNMGSQWVGLADRLTQFDNVIIIAAGIGGTSIQQWVDNDWLYQRVQTPYKITHFLWVQGEADSKYHPSTMTADQYASNLRTIIYRTKTGFPDSSFYVSIATICADLPDVDLENAQRSVIGNGVYQGANLDLYGQDMRYDTCHLGSVAQEKAIDQWVNILEAR